MTSSNKDLQAEKKNKIGSVRGDSQSPAPVSKGQTQTTPALCASCDRCRARKTKCDGARPCGNCAVRYLKKHKLSSIEGIDPSLFGCVYSPAKRRGPVPGRITKTRKAEGLDNAEGHNKRQVKNFSSIKKSDIEGTDLSLQQHIEKQKLAALGVESGDVSNPFVSGNTTSGVNALPSSLDESIMAVKQHHLMLHAKQSQFPGVNIGGLGALGGNDPASSLGGFFGNQRPFAATTAAQQQLNYLQQLQQQQLQLQGLQNMDTSSQIQQIHQLQVTNQALPPRQKLNSGESSKTSNGTSLPLPKCVGQHLSLLLKTDQDGNRLRAYYQLSIDDLFCLPPIPTDEDYCERLPLSIKPSQMPRFDVAALNAARFSEIAIGAWVNKQMPLAFELSNATVSCLRACVEEPVHPICMYDVARAYFLHGLLMSYRGDIARYFKYRRVCLTHLSQLDNVQGVEALLASISFHDTWAYQIFNASEKNLPRIDESIPPLPPQQQSRSSSTAKYGISSDPSAIASNPLNQMWIQGSPPVFINNKAPPISRSIDALACAIRTCCDIANTRVSKLENGKDNEDSVYATPTSSAVKANKNELCSRNMILSAFTLLQVHEASKSTLNRNYGHHLIISLMDAFLEGGEGDTGGFTDSQIQSLLSVCISLVEHPILLYQPGPTYHMITNAAILLCHLLNLMTKEGSDVSGEMEKALFEEILDTYITTRKVLNIHRRALPVNLRCHCLPRPNLYKSDAPIIDMDEIIMCKSKGCKAFVLMGCSPAVAEERAKKDKIDMEYAAARDSGVGDSEDEVVAKELDDLEAECDVDDDALLDILSRIIAA